MSHVETKAEEKPATATETETARLDHLVRLATSLTPWIGQVHAQQEGWQSVNPIEIPEAVTAARDTAIVAAFRAIARLADGLHPASGSIER